MGTDCIFCKINAGDIPSYTVYEDENTRALLDTQPSTEGHVLVIHKMHGETILDYSSEQLKELFTSVQKTALAVSDTFHTSILSIGINHGEPSGVHHLHVHIIPRYDGDGGKVLQSLVAGTVIDDLSLVQSRIRTHIK